MNNNEKRKYVKQCICQSFNIIHSSIKTFYHIICTHFNHFILLRKALRALSKKTKQLFNLISEYIIHMNIGTIFGQLWVQNGGNKGKLVNKVEIIPNWLFFRGPISAKIYRDKVNTSVYMCKYNGMKEEDIYRVVKPCPISVLFVYWPLGRGKILVLAK